MAMNKNFKGIGQQIINGTYAEPKTSLTAYEELKNWLRKYVPNDEYSISPRRIDWDGAVIYFDSDGNYHFVDC